MGFCTLKLNDLVREGCSGLWISDLVVDPKYQKQGIGKMLIAEVVTKSKELGFDKIYLFTFDEGVVEYYSRLGWKEIGMDEFKFHPVTVMELGL